MNKMCPTRSEVIKFLAYDENDKIDGHLFKRILVAISSMSLDVCNNCKMSPDDCLNGTQVTPENAVVGAKISGPGIPHGSEITRKHEQIVTQNAKFRGYIYVTDTRQDTRQNYMCLLVSTYVYQCK